MTGGSLTLVSPRAFIHLCRHQKLILICLVDNDFHRTSAVFDLFNDLEIKDFAVELPGKPETNGTSEQNGTAAKN